jgi:hypothetical protein
MQNRESAVRSRHKKKEGIEYLKSENEILKKENYHLYHENLYLKKEKNFLIDQIKFMQNLIKSNGMLIKTNTCSNENYDIEKNMPDINKTNSEFKQNHISLNGERQKPFSKIFSVFIICIISVFYISFNNTELDSNEKIVFKGGSTISLNDDNDRKLSDSDKNNINILKTITSYEIIMKILIVLGLSVLILNFSNMWMWIKKKFENNKKLYKNL